MGFGSRCVSRRLRQEPINTEARFASLWSRVEDTIQSARDCRDSVVGSFDVLHARSEQRTNEIMKVLTLGTVILLPAMAGGS